MPGAEAKHQQRLKKQGMYSFQLINKNCYTVLNAFGIKGRAPAPLLRLLISRNGPENMDLHLDIIKEACDRTIAGIASAQISNTQIVFFPKWSKQRMSDIYSDIAPLDQAFRQERPDRQRRSQLSKASLPAQDIFQEPEQL